MSELHRPNVAILASGNGFTAEAYARAIHDRLVDAEIGLVVVNNEQAGILGRVERWNREWGFDTETRVINNAMYPRGAQPRGQTTQAAEALCDVLKKKDIDLVAQLGFMVICNDPYISEWGFVPGRHSSPYESRALNSHPGLLPLTANSFGTGAADLMLKAYHRGEITEAGHTVHAVAQKVDAGPKTAEHSVPIEPNDTKEVLFERIRLVEQTAIAYAIDSFVRKQRAYRSAHDVTM